MKEKEPSVATRQDVASRLEELVKIHRERAAVYGDDYLYLGEIMVGLFPGGLTLNSDDDFRRFAIFNYIVGKVNRYAQSFTKGGHADSLDDIAVYTQILRRLDDLCEL